MTAPATPPDQAARDLVSSTGLERTLFVEAGAGTGKTTQLVERISNLVLDRGVRLVHIAAITFTEAAAAELQARIRQRFEEHAAASEPGTDVHQRCLDALADADLAAISTLHGFASRLLGEFAVAAGLPPRVQVLDEVSSQLAHEERWERFLDALYDDPAREDALIRAACVDAALEPRYPGQSTLKDVAAELNDNWDRLTALAATPLAAICPVDVTAYDRAVDALVERSAQCGDPDDKFLLHLTRTLLPEMLAIAGMDDPNRKLRALASLKPWGRGQGGRNDAWDGDVKGAKDLVNEVNDAVAQVVGAAADEVLRYLLVLIAEEVLAAARARREDGRLEFHDLLVLTRDMLRRDVDARSTLHDRYTHLLLDEFQDTDPIQIELATLIAASIVGSPTAGWGDLDVDDGRLFFVGDPKQSIYRFRRADIELFLAARDRFGPDGTWARLTTNFRTVAPVLDWVNAYFASVMAEERPGQQPRYEALSAWRQGAPGTDHRPILLGGPHPDPKVKAGQLRADEAGSVAALIAEVRDRPQRWPVLGDDGQWRSAALRDVTILVPTRTSVPYLREALEAQDLPYRLATGTLVYDTQEVRDALAALKAIDDVTDELSLVATLRSPLYACSDVDLFTYRAAGGRWDVRKDPPAALAADHPVVVAVAHLRGLWEQRWWLSPSTMLERLLRERRAYLLAFGDPRPTEVWRRLRFLQDQARQFEEAGGGDLRDFLAWTELQGADGAKVHEPLLPETDDDSVQILTIHGAKGLEFPITIVSGMTTQTRGARRGVSLTWGEHDELEVKLRQGVATANHDPRADIELEMDVHEKVRLLYVATTRARDHLVVSCHHKAGKADTYAGQVWQYFAERTDLWQPFALDPTLTPTATVIAGGSTGTSAGSARPSAGSSVGSSAEDLQLLEPSADGAAGPHASGAAPGVGAAGEVGPAPDRAAWIEQREALLAPQRESRTISATAVARLAQAPDDSRPIAGGDGPVEPADGERQDVGDPADVDVQPDVDVRLDIDDLADVDEPADPAAAAEPTPASVVPTRRRGRAGSAVGRAVHATLQVTDLRDPRDVDAQVARQCDVESIPELAPVVAALVRSALASDAVQLAASSTYHRELYVAAPVGERVIEGYIDLLIETPDGLIVVDYKTDSATTDAEIDAKLATYELQGATYVVALEEATGLDVVDCRFVFCRAAGAIERSVTDLPAATARVRQILAG